MSSFSSTSHPIIIPLEVLGGGTVYWVEGAGFLLGDNGSVLDDAGVEDDDDELRDDCLKWFFGLFRWKCAETSWVNIL